MGACVGLAMGACPGLAGDTTAPTKMALYLEKWQHPTGWGYGHYADGHESTITDEELEARPFNAMR